VKSLEIDCSCKGTMAVSPQVIQNGAASVNITASKTKALAVRTSSIGSGQVEQRTLKPRGAELAEQLNEETKQKYVKGAPSMLSIPISTLSNIV